MKKLNSSTILIIVCAIVVAGAAYWYFFMGASNQPTVTATSGGSAAQAKFEMLSNQLAGIHFNTQIFSNPKFEALVSLHTPVTTQPKGRTDPFAPYK